MSPIINLSFEKSFSCLQVWKDDSKYRLFIQSIDAYSYQRELIISWDYELNQYKVHAYLHPAARMITHVSDKAGLALINEIINIVTRYPNNLFNAAGDTANGPAQNRGFVYFHTRLLAGETPSVKML